MTKILSFVAKIIVYFQIFFSVSHTFLEYLKLVEIAMTHILGLVEKERCFSFVIFEKQIAELIEASSVTCCYVWTKFLHSRKFSICSYI
jgi:hypothetical protein